MIMTVDAFVDFVRHLELRPLYILDDHQIQYRSNP